MNFKAIVTAAACATLLAGAASAEVPPPTETPTPTPTNTQGPPTATPFTANQCPGGPGGLLPTFGHSGAAVDCRAEVCSFAVPPEGTNVLHPPRRLTCQEGDPRCDFGPAGDNTCTFMLAFCFNVADTRSRCIAPEQVMRFHLVDPSEGDPKGPLDLAIRDAIEAALLGLPGAAITNTPVRSVLFAPPLIQTGICTVGTPINIPLREARGGLRKRSLLLRYRTFAAPDRLTLETDRDMIVLMCTP